MSGVFDYGGALRKLHELFRAWTECPVSRSYIRTEDIRCWYIFHYQIEDEAYYAIERMSFFTAVSSRFTALSRLYDVLLMACSGSASARVFPC